MLISFLNKFLIHTKEILLGEKSKMLWSILTKMLAVKSILGVKSKLKISKSAQILHVVAL